MSDFVDENGIRKSYLKNFVSLFTPNQEFDLRFAVSYKNYVYKNKNDEYSLNKLDYFWELKGLNYDPNANFSYAFNVTVPIDDKILD